ncbi:MAG: hypothetical protein Q8M22_14030 [Actinomycetota bacterium]|nr:hypothetical protein [Actinomycetota bacterium]
MLNVVGIGIFLLAFLLLVLRQKSGRPAPYWAWPLCLLNISLDKIYLPIGPVLVLLILASDRSRTNTSDDSVPA